MRSNWALCATAVGGIVIEMWYCNDVQGLSSCIDTARDGQSRIVDYSRIF